MLFLSEKLPKSNYDGIKHMSFNYEEYIKKRSLRRNDKEEISLLSSLDSSIIIFIRIE